jgi:hypothetical protein
VHIRYAGLIAQKFLDNQNQCIPGDNFPLAREPLPDQASLSNNDSPFALVAVRA